MKRCLCIVASLNAGGAETFLMKVFKKMKNEYVLDFVVSEEKKGFYHDDVVKMGGRVFYVPMRTKAPVKAYKALKAIVSENGYNYVLKLCDTPIGITDVMAVKAGGAKRVSVRSCNASADVSVFKRILNCVLRPFFNALIDVKIAPSDLAAEYTFGRNQVKRGQVHFLHNAVDLSVFRYDTQDRDVIRQELGMSEKTVIGHIGRFSAQKNHFFLLDVFKKVKEIDHTAILMLVGKGELEGAIKEKAESLGVTDNIVFTGVRSDVPKLLSAMDVFVLPSFYEGMPNTVIEAQATGLSCVIADTITQQANITGLVKYLPLTESAEHWASMVLEAAKLERRDTKQDFFDNKYDIESTVEGFKKLVFGE